MTIELVSEEDVKKGKRRLNEEDVKGKRRLNDPEKSYNTYKTYRNEPTTKEKGWQKRLQK